MATEGDAVMNEWEEYEMRKKALPPMGPDDYEDAVREICEDLGL